MNEIRPGLLRPLAALMGNIGIVLVLLLVLWANLVTPPFAEGLEMPLWQLMVNLGRAILHIFFLIVGAWTVWRFVHRRWGL